jgi:autotransporter translocation and assembly factor TamB
MRALVWLVLWSTVLTTAAQAAPRTIRDADGLARWLGRLRPSKAGLEVAAVAQSPAFELRGTPIRAERRVVRLQTATLRFGPVEATGALEVRKTQRPRGLHVTGALHGVTVAGLPLGDGQLDVSWSRRAGWSGHVGLRGGAVKALDLRLAPVPKRVRCRRGADCPTPGPRLTVALDGLDLAAAIAQFEPPRWLARLAGPVHVSGGLDGSLTDPWGALQITAAPTWDGRAVGALTVALARGVEADQLTVGADLVGPLARVLRVRATGPWQVDVLEGPRWRGTQQPQVAVDALGMTLAAWTDLFPVLALEGSLDLNLRFGGNDDGLGLAGQGLRWRGAEVGQLALQSAWANERLKGAAAWGPTATPHVATAFEVPLALDGRAMTLRWLDREAGSITVQAQGLTPQVLAPFWHAHPAAKFSLGGQLSASGTLATLQLKGALNGTLQDRDQPALPLVGTLQGDARTQLMHFSVGEVLTWTARTRAPLVAIRAGTQRWESAPVFGDFTVALSLPTMGPYLPRGIFDPEGQVEGAVAVAGTLGAPTFTGRLVLPDAEFTVVPLRQRLHGVRMQADLADTTMTISTLAARSGVGSLVGGGSMTLTATPEGHPVEGGLWGAWRLVSGLQFEVAQFPFVQDVMPAGLLDAKVQVDSVSGPGEQAVTVTVQEAAVALTDVELPGAQAVPQNHRVQVMDWAGDVRSDDQLFSGDGHLVFTLTLAQPVRVEGGAISVVLGGGLKLDRTEARAVVEGGLEVLEGHFELFENAFELQRGRLSLQPGLLGKAAISGEAGHATLRDPDAPPEARPLEPVFELVAVGRAVRTEVDVTVRGPARRPELLLVSEPPLPEYRILTLLITGRVDAVDDRNGDVRRQVAKLVDRFHNPSLSRQLYDRLGVDKLDLGFGSSVTQPILTVGKQINRQLFVETVYHHNAPPEANEKEAHVEYRLDPRWTVDTVYGDAAMGSLGVFWKTDWGGPKPKARKAREAQPEPAATP